MNSDLTENIASRPSGRFDHRGMMLALLGGLVAAVLVGLALSFLKSALPISIPIIPSLVAGFVVGMVTLSLGRGIGRCRNPAVAIAVAALCAVAAWCSERTTDYYRFRAHSHHVVVQSDSTISEGEVELAIDAQLLTETGHDGIVGFIIFQAANSRSQFATHFGSGMSVPAFELHGIGLLIYWGIEGLVTILAAVWLNRDYAKQRYCDKCLEWRVQRTPHVGTDANLNEVIARLEAHDMRRAVEFLERDSHGRIARLEVELCPQCYDSEGVELVVVDAEPSGAWKAATVWSEKLPATDVSQLMGLHRKA